MKNLFTLLSHLRGSMGNLQSSDAICDRRSTVVRPSGLEDKLQLNTFVRFAVVLTLIFTLGVGEVWGAAPKLSDLSFSTESSVRIVNENFNACSTTDKTAKMAANADLSGFGAFNKGYNNSTSNHYAIESSTFGSNGVKITMGSGSPCGIAISGKTFGTKGAWRITTTKASKMYAGIYAEGATSTAYAKANASVYIQNNAGSISISQNTSSGNWQSVGSSSNTTIDICVIYNNTATPATYGNSISLPAKSAHVYIDGICVMNGESPKSFTISGLTLSTFRVYAMPTSGNVASIDDIQIWNALPGAASCTAPSSVSISGTTKYLGGQTISLTATPSGGSGTATYQWQKKISGTWTDLSNGTVSGVTTSGATTNNLTISPCTHENSGGYRCVVSTGATCSTKSHADDNAGYGVHVFSIHGKYTTDADYSDTEIIWTSGTTGTATIHLNAKKTFLFKVWSNNGYYYGHGANANEDFMFQPTTWDCGVSNREMRLFTTVEGDYTFTVNIEHGLDGSPYVNLQIGYPSMTHPNTGYVYVQKFSWRPYLHYWYNNDNVLSTWGNDPQLNADQYIEICGTEYWCVPVIDYYCNFIAKDAAGAPSNTTGDQHTNSPHPGQKLYNDGSWKWGDFVKYTITFAGNGNTDGSTPSVEDICPGSNATLTANGFTKTGYTFDGWTPSANVTVGSTTYTPSDVVPGGSIIKAVSGNLTMTAHWTEDLHNVTVEYKCGATTVSSSTTIENVGITTTGTTTAPASFTGYTWSTWSAMPSGVTTSTTPLTTRAIVINATADGKTITANYTANQYNITYKDQGNVAYSGNGTAGVPTGAPTTHTYGSATALVNGSKTGYDFGGWFTDKECTVSAGSSIGATAITADITLYAKWTLHTYTISSTLNNCTSDPSIPSSYTYTGTAAGLNYTLTANSGYALPASVTVSGVTYTWNQATGVLALTGTISSDVSIIVTALPQVTWMAGGSVFNTQSGTAGTALSNPGTPSNSTYCDGIKVFVGWSASTINGTTDTKPADLFSSAAATKKTLPAGGTTYYAVFATRSGTNPTSITTFATGTYYLIDKCGDNYYAMSGSTASGITAVDVTSSVTVKSTTITVDPSIFTDDMEYVITGTSSAAHITQSETAIYNTSGTSFNNNSGSNWAVTESSDKFEFSGNNRCILYQSSSNVFKNYATSNMGNSGYSSGYLFIVPIATYTGYATTCAECTTAAIVGAATLKGDFSLSSVGVTCPTSGTSVGTNCSWLDYGFVWSPSSNTTPTIGGTNCTKVQTGTTGSSNTWDDDLESTFVVGNTYYYRAYGMNGKAESDFVYGTVNSFIPRSVTFNLNGHGESAPSTQYVPDGGKAADPSYSEAVAGWTFGGWYKEEGCTNAWDFGTNTVGSGNVTLHAKWTEKPKYTITLNAGNGTISDANWTNTSGSTYTRTQSNGDEAITLPTPSCNCSGWVFQGWSTTSKDNAASFTPDKEDGASFAPTSNVTYYAVYRQNATGGTTYNKITSTGDLTTGNYIFMSSGGYAMKNVVTSSRMDEVGDYTASNSSQTIDNANLVWTIAKFSSQVVIKNGANYLGIDADNNICLTTTPHFFTYTYNAGSSRWEFTSATKTSYQLVYNSYFKIGASQTTAIYLYKQGAGLTGNYYTNPSCSEITVTGAVSPAGSGTVTLTAGSGKTGDKVYAMYTSDEDYNFDEWTISGTGSTLGSTTAVVTEITIGTANTTVTANFVAKDWKTVTWKANGNVLTGEDLGSASVKVENGFDITALPPSPDPCDGTSTTFIGWVAESEIWSGPTDDISGVTIYEDVSDFQTVTDDVTYHAVWARQNGSAAPATYAGTGVFTKITTLEELEVGAHYVLYGMKDDDNTVKGAMNNTFTNEAAGKNVFGASSVTISDNKITNPAATVVWKLGGTTDAYTLYSQNSSKYIEITANDSRGYTNPSSATTSFTISVSEGNFKIVSNGASAGSRMISIYTASVFRSYSYLTEGYTLNLYKYGSNYTYDRYLVKCCNTPTLAFAASPYAVLREDLGGASTTTWAEVDVTFTSNSSGEISATKYSNATVTNGTAYQLAASKWQVYETTGGTLCGASHAYFEVLTQPSGETPGTGKFYVKTAGGQTGQGTYRIAITQAATDESHGNFCETTVYGFVDVTLRDKFVDNVNGNGTINRDGHGAQLATPTLSEFGTQEEDACHSEGRKLKGWIKETDLKAQYETGSSTRVQTVDGLCETCADGTDQTSLIVAPGANVTMSGATWYAVWAYEK